MSRKARFNLKVTIMFVILMMILSITSAFAEDKKIEKPKSTVGSKTIVDLIRIESGLISGKTIGDTAKEVRAYLGIPYAAPPVGDLRWKPPQPIVPWSGVRDCTQYSKTAVQGSPGGPFDFYPQDEDCLYLNVVTPAKNVNEKLPVMVFFHGGSFDMGSGNNPRFSHYRLPQNGVIVVSVNTRLGVLGLLAHPLLSKESPKGVSGNYMFLDMLASLEWVKRNITSFGGDPDNVTIFGESSGGWKVATMLLSPLAEGLFKKAILQSGGAGEDKKLSDLENSGKKYFNTLGVTTLEEARKVPWKKIKESKPDLNSYWPAIDGWVIDDNPAELFSAGKINQVQIMVGLNQGELGQGADKVISDYINMLNSLRKAGNNGYVYIFDQVPSNWKKKGGKAVHALDLFYVFGDYDHKIPDDWNLMYEQEKAYGIGSEDKDPVMTETDKKVSEDMMAVWAQFAKTGNPSLTGLITVPAWEPGTDKYLYIADPLQIKSGFSTIASSSENIAGSRQSEQERKTIPLNSIPYGKTTLSKKDMDRILGTWLGKPVLPQGGQNSGEIPTYLFRFEITETGEFKGTFEFPEIAQPPISITSIEMDDDILNFKVPFMVFKGKIAGNEIVGELKYPDEPKVPTISLTLKKGEYVAQTYKLNLPKKTIDQLLGEWNGKITIQEFSMTLVFRFEMTGDGDFVGFFDLPDQGTKGVSVTKADLSDGKLILISFIGEFKGQLSGGKIVGDLIQGEVSNPLTLKKGEYKAQIQ